MIYLFLYLFYIKTDTNTERIKMGRMLDIMVFSFSLIYVVTLYFNTSMSDLDQSVSKYIVKFGEYLDDPFSLFSLIILVFAFYLLMYLIEIPLSNEFKPLSISLIENLLIILVTIFLIFDFFKFFFNINFNTTFIPQVLDWWNTKSFNIDFESIKNTLYSLFNTN